MFQPFRYQGRLLVDGAVKNRLPIHVAQKMGADKILAVDVKKALSTKLNTAVDVLFQSMEILEEEVFRSVCTGADLLIQPEVGHIGSLQFDAAAEAIDLGRQSAVAKTAEIRRLFT
ncbi:patatin-like phospholipase family protein [Desulfitobacterium sp. AusDCA]